MRKVNLRMNELEKYNVIKELVDHNGNKKRAALQLGLTLRQINRLIITYKEKGKSGFQHGNRNKKPVNTLDKSIPNNIILLYNTKHNDFYFNHFKNMIIMCYCLKCYKPIISLHNIAKQDYTLIYIIKYS